MKRAYIEFEERLGNTKSPRGAKTMQIKEVVRKTERAFSLSDLERECPGVSRDMIRRVLRQLQKEEKVECLGRGPGALWAKRGNTLKRGQ